MSGEIIVPPEIGTSDTSFLTPQDVFSTGSGALKFIENIPSSISDFFSGAFSKPSTPIDTTINTRTPTVRINPNLVVGSAATVGTGVIIYATATNPGVQKTVQANTGAIQSIADAFKTTAGAGAQFTDFLTKNPLILVGGLAILAIALIKK